MKKIILFFLFCIGLIYSPNASGQAFDKNDLEAEIDALIPTSVNDSTPGLVIGIVNKGELIFSKGYGLANISYGILNDPKMVYNIGSVSKQFLGYAFAMLHVKGDLNIDDPVGKYLEDWPEFKHVVTLRHLLAHSSGYREAYTMSFLSGRIIGEDRLSREECLEVVRRQPQLDFTPGSRFSYNSTAWVILAEVMKKVTGEPADQWVKANILQPLKMNDTQIESYIGEVINNAAESYVYNEELGYINKKSNRAIFGAAEVYTNIYDLVKWMNNYRTIEMDRQAVNELFLTPFMLSDGLNSEYGLGIYNSSYRGLRRYRHTGAHEAFGTQLSYFPDHDMGIITISNFGGRGWFSTTKIADILLEEYMDPVSEKECQPIEIKQKKLEEFAGLYLSESLNSTLTFSIDKNTLTIGGNIKLIPVKKNTFQVDGQDQQFQFKNVSKGKTELITARNETFTKVEKWSPSKEELLSFTGEYWSNELETVYHLIVKDENLIIQHRWIGEMLLEPITKDFFKTDGGWGFYVKFNRNEDGDISSLSVNSGGTLNVDFHRKK